MITLFGPITADVLEGDLPYLKVKPQRKLSQTEQVVNLRVGVARKLRLKVKPVEREAGATWVEVVDFLGSRAQLIVALARLDDRRAVQRSKVDLLVRSPDLPDFHARTIDVSQHGSRLAISRPVSTGVKLRLQLEGRGVARCSVGATAVTVWSRQDSGGQNLVGVRFLEPLDTDLHQLA